jgi:hypothetical protein
LIEGLALAVLSIAGTYFTALGAVSLWRPHEAKKFLLGFASSPTRHYGEVAARFVVGGSLVLVAPRLFHPAGFSLAGWALLITTAGLLVVPWRWHQRFAQRAVPRTAPYIPLMGACAVCLGGLLVAAVVLSLAA